MWQKPAMTYAEAADAMGINVDQVRTAAAVKKVALPEIVAAIWDGRIKTVGHAYSIVTPDKTETLDGLTSEAKQRKWLKDPSNLPRKPRQTRAAAPTRIITDRALKELTDAQATVIAIKLIPRIPDHELVGIVERLMPRVNRVLERQGKRLAYVPIQSGS
jgi:hypothetical protein